MDLEQQFGSHRIPVIDEMHFICQIKLMNSISRWDFSPFLRIDDARSPKYFTQFVFMDLITGCLNAALCFAKMKSDRGPPVSEVSQLLNFGLQHVVEYPIMCYTPPDLERKTIMVCNL